MTKNTNKGDAYQYVLSKLKLSVNSDDIFHMIGLIATTESIFSDRLSAFLNFINNDKFNEYKKNYKYVSFGKMLEFSKKELEIELTIKTKLNSIISTKNLYLDLKCWNTKRNILIHSVCKSDYTETYEGLSYFILDAKSCCIDSYRLLRLILKWDSKLKNITN